MHTFYRRPLPQHLISFALPEGRALFAQALNAGTMTNYFRIAQQFHTQAEPAFCGLGSLVVALNALDIDPGRMWKGPWRWFSEELLDCCLPLEAIQEKGLTLDEMACLAHCNGARAHVHRTQDVSLEAFRKNLISSSKRDDGCVMIVNFSRAELGQTGHGHFSPVGGYNAERDLVLVMDVARFKYPPFWVSLALLWRAMSALDVSTNKGRGWVEVWSDQSVLSLGFLFEREGEEDLREVSTMLRTALAAQHSQPSPDSLRDACARHIRMWSSIGWSLRRRSVVASEHSLLVNRLLKDVQESEVWGHAQDLTKDTLMDPWVVAMLLLSPPSIVLQRLPEHIKQEWLRVIANTSRMLEQESSYLRIQLDALIECSLNTE